MQWIRENLFLACLIGALVVCFGAAFTVRSGQDAAFEADMEPRGDTASDISELNSSKPVNKKWLAKTKGRIEGIRLQRDKIVKDAAEWNKKNYSVLKLKSTANGATETIPAFPYDSAAYQKKFLTSQFTNTYRIVLYGALAKLDLASWPTDIEIGELSVKIEKDMQSNRKAAINRVEYAQRRSGTPAPKPPAGADKPEEEAKKPEGVSQEDWNLSRLTDSEVHDRARRNATDQLVLKKANSGVMFVSPQTLAMVSDPKLPGGAAGPGELDVIFPKEIWQWLAAPAAKLWEAQLNLWITQDILAAIDATNDQSLRTAGSKRTVPNAAVKLLRGIAIEEQYLMQAGGDVIADVKADLTQRTTTSEYEIIGYEFAVVMKTEYLPALIGNLMLRGDHTVTDLSIEYLSAGRDGMRYYGTDPVASIKLAGEVLFRSSWTRKIMPIETLRDRLGSVLRPEDTERLEKARQ